MAERFFAYLPQILEQMPASWRGTTFNNLQLLGRAGFAARLDALLASKGSGEQLTTADLSSLGEAEDYLRVASNVSTLLEMALAHQRGLAPDRVFSFASRALPVLSVCLAAGAGRHVALYLDEREPFFSPVQLEALTRLNLHLSQHAGRAPRPRVAAAGVIVLEAEQTGKKNNWSGKDSGADGVVGEGALFVLDASVIDPAQILVRRKRMGCPVTTPAALAQLRAIAGLPEAPEPVPAPAEFAEMAAHLTAMSGADPSLPPLFFSAGLSALASLWFALAAGAPFPKTVGGVDEIDQFPKTVGENDAGAEVLIASTAYGGSSQLTDLLASLSANRFRKHAFDVAGAARVEESVAIGLQRLEQLSASAALLPRTVLFLENPTNPDMKVADLGVVSKLLRAHGEKTGRQVALVVDTTFAPASNVLRHLQKVDQTLTAVNFISLSKSVSRGHTVAGCLLFNGAANRLHGEVDFFSRLFDSGARTDQLIALVKNHSGVEERCRNAYATAQRVSVALVDLVKQLTGQHLHLEFVPTRTAEQGFTSSTFSFNLPPLPGKSLAENEALAQRFVDLLAEKKSLFKPCVSFGQDNGLVYATVPATSTQGAIRAEDKEKQAQGGVQLVRLSFPPVLDEEGAVAVMRDALKKLYEK